MNKTLCASGAFALLLAISGVANAYHIKNTEATHGFNATVAADAGNPINFGPRTGASFIIDDPTNENFQVAGNKVGLCYLLSDEGPLGASAPENAEDILCGDSNANGPDGTEGCGEPSTGGHEGVFGFCSGDLIFGFTTCEQNAGATTPSRAGSGGLCFMSQGYDITTGDDPAGACEPVYGASYDYGRSDQKYDPYTSATEPATCSAMPAAGATLPMVTDESRWNEYANFCMFEPGALGSDTSPTCIKFSSQVAGIDCSGSGTAAYVKLIWLHETGQGHMAGFPGADPPAGSLGSYQVYSATAANLAAGTPCNGASPWSYA